MHIFGCRYTSQGSIDWRHGFRDVVVQSVTRIADRRRLSGSQCRNEACATPNNMRDLGAAAQGGRLSLDLCMAP